jgi:hypothetical protein
MPPILLDESDENKGGDLSVGAGRQLNGRLGKVEICQVGVLIAYAQPQHGLWVLVDGTLYLPEHKFATGASRPVPETANSRGAPLLNQAGPESGHDPANCGDKILTVQGVAFDDLYACKNELWWALGQDWHLEYAAKVLEITQVDVNRSPKQITNHSAFNLT